MALIRGPWNDVIDLGAEQEVAVLVSRNVAGVAKILDPKSNQPCVVNHPQPRLPAHQPPAKIPDGDAMEIDETSTAMKDVGFSYPEFCQECVDCNICI